MESFAKRSYPLLTAVPVSYFYIYSDENVTVNRNISHKYVGNVILLEMEYQGGGELISYSSVYIDKKK